MDEDRETVADMSEKIRSGEYRVEPVAVADAIVRQLRAVAAARTQQIASGDRASAADAVLRLSAHTPRARLASQ